MSLEVTDSTFYMVQIPDSESLHQTDEEAIAFLKEHVDDVDPETDDVSVVRISVEDGDWTIAEMSWQNIALQLMGGE